MEWGDLLLTINASVGTPPQSFEVVLDINNHDTWIPSATGKSNYNSVDAKNFYNSTLSTTYRPNGTKTSIWWYDTVFDGFLSQDHVTLGDVQVKNHLFQEWNYTRLRTIAGYSNGYDGVLGLAYRGEPHIENPPGILQRLTKQKTLQESIFSLRIPHSLQELGELRFGSRNEDLYESELVRLPHAPPLDGPLRDLAVFAWNIPISNVQYNTPMPMISSFPKGATAILDTMSPFIFLPDDLAQNLSLALEARPGPAFYRHVDCSQRWQMPTLSFQLGNEGHIFNMTALDYTRELGPFCVLTFMSASDLANHDGSLNATILGQPFLRRFYSVFDWEDKSVQCKLI